MTEVTQLVSDRVYWPPPCTPLYFLCDLKLDLRQEERTWQERWMADLIRGSFQEQFLFGNVAPQPGGSLRAHAVWLAGLLFFPAQGTGSLGLRHEIKFSRINIPDSLRGQGPGAGAHNELGSILDCHGWRAGAPGTRTSASSSAGAGITHRPAVARFWWV